MPRVEFHLPGSRGVLKGPEGTILRQEQARAQAAELPKEKQLWLSTIPVVSPVSDVTVTSDSGVYYPVEAVKDALLLTAVAVNVTGGDTGTLSTQLYRIQSPSEMILRAVPKTKATFDTSVVGRQEFEFSEPVKLLPSSRYYIGVHLAGGALGPTFVGVAGGTADIIRRVTTTGTTMPDVVPIANKSETVDFVAVAYLTEFGRAVA